MKQYTVIPLRKLNRRCFYNNHDFIYLTENKYCKYRGQYKSDRSIKMTEKQTAAKTHYLLTFSKEWVPME